MAQSGLIEAGNVDLYAQPKVKNPNGTISTVDSIGVNVDGHEVLLPTVTPDGRHFTGPRAAALAFDEYKKTGRHLGIFKDVASSNAYGAQLHNEYAAGKYDRRMSDQQSSQLSIADMDLPDTLTPEQVQRINATLGKADVTPEDIQGVNAMLTKAYQAANPKAKQPPMTSWVIDKAVSWLPLAGAAAGTAALAVGGPVAAALGAGIGGTAGKMAEHAIQSARGKEDIHGAGGVLDAVTDSAASGSKDALGTLAFGGIAKGLPLAGPALSAGGRLVAAASESKAVQGLSKAAGVLTGIFGHLPGGVAVYHAPEVGAVAGKAMQSAGAALESRAAAKAATAAAQTVAERAAQIPLRERLAQIPLQDISEAWQTAKAATPNASIADDVSMVRGLVSIGFNQDTAIKIASGGSKDAAAAVKAGWMQSLKAKGAPIPEAAMKTSGKIAPAVSELMESPTFKALAESVAARSK